MTESEAMLLKCLSEHQTLLYNDTNGGLHEILQVGTLAEMGEWSMAWELDKTDDPESVYLAYAGDNCVIKIDTRDVDLQSVQVSVTMEYAWSFVTNARPWFLLDPILYIASRALMDGEFFDKMKGELNLVDPDLVDLRQMLKGARLEIEHKRRLQEDCHD